MSAASVEGGIRSDLLQARRPAVYFAATIGDAVLTLPTIRALGDMFDAPLTLICPEFAFSLCFREVSPCFVHTAGWFDDTFHPMLEARSTLDRETLAAQIGPVDVLINTVWFNMPSDPVRIMQRHPSLSATIGFENDYEEYDVAIPRAACHAAEHSFKLAQVFDSSVRIEDYAQPVSIPSQVQRDAMALRDTVPPGSKLLVVHADTNWAAKRWPVTRFVDVLDRFLARHRDYVAWVVGMGQEELDVGRERDRVVPQLGLPLDLTMSLVASADLFLGIDSCMLHAADLARVPGVGLFGHTRAAQWGFRFGPHRHVDLSTMADITVDEVLSAMEDLVERPE